ncbi:hypothetical protein [Parabacteroides distasonis]
MNCLSVSLYNRSVALPLCTGSSLSVSGHSIVTGVSQRATGETSPT